MKLNYRYIFISLFFITVFGIIHLPYPFFGDQAFFLLGAKEMNEGMVLYKDFWDIKQPAIFFFYQFAGKIFGFTEVGIHIFELIYWLIFAVTLIWFLKKINAFKNEILVYYAPVVILGTYYGFSNHVLLTQVETLVSFPILLTLAFNLLFFENNNFKSFWIFLAGFFGGIVLLFKLIFAPILLGLWTYSIFHLYLNKRDIKLVLANFIKLGFGVLLSWFPFILYCYYHNIIELCYETFLKYPPLILKFGEKKSFYFLFKSFYYFASSVNLTFALCLVSFLLINRLRTFLISLWIWLIFATIVIILQATSWFHYQFQILYTPLILTSLFVLDYIFNKITFIISEIRIKNILVVKSFFICIYSLPIIFSILLKIKELEKHGFAMNREKKVAFALMQKDNYEAYQSSIFLNNLNEEKCPIFVFNNPLVYYYTNRDQATAQNFWSPQIYIPGQLEILFSELQQSRPCYIFIYTSLNPLMKKKANIIFNWIDKNYVIVYTSIEGCWYKIK